MGCGPLVDISDSTYAEWRKLSAAIMRRERHKVTLSATALLHEAILRLPREQFALLVDNAKPILRTIMRHLLIDHARRRRRRQAYTASQLQFDHAPEQPAKQYPVQDAIRRLAVLDQRQAAIVEMRIVAGLSNDEIAKRLGCSSRTIARDWITARLWLQRELGS